MRIGLKWVQGMSIGFKHAWGFSVVFHCSHCQVGLGRDWNEQERPDSNRMFTRSALVSDELFDVGTLLEVGSCRFLQALSPFMKSCVTRVIRLKAVSVVVRAHYRVS
jgi:hypothetical protein